MTICRPFTVCLPCLLGKHGKCKKVNCCCVHLELNGEMTNEERRKLKLKILKLNKQGNKL